MSSEQLFTRVPFETGHSHFFQSIVAFPELPTGPSFEDKEKYIKDSLKYQLLNGNPEQAKRYVQMRDCFKLVKKRYIEFCLQEKVPGVSLNQAATELGYRK